MNISWISLIFLILMLLVMYITYQNHLAVSRKTEEFVMLLDEAQAVQNDLEQLLGQVLEISETIIEDLKACRGDSPFDPVSTAVVADKRPDFALPSLSAQDPTQSSATISEACRGDDPFDPVSTAVVADKRPDFALPSLSAQDPTQSSATISEACRGDSPFNTISTATIVDHRPEGAPPAQNISGLKVKPVSSSIPQQGKMASSFDLQNIHAVVNNLYKKGFTTKEIAQKLDKGQDEVSLILNLLEMV